VMPAESGEGEGKRVRACPLPEEVAGLACANYARADLLRFHLTCPGMSRNSIVLFLFTCAVCASRLPASRILKIPDLPLSGRPRALTCPNSSGQFARLLGFRVLGLLEFSF
jgi:hypothetical protein